MVSDRMKRDPIAGSNRSFNQKDLFLQGRRTSRSMPWVEVASDEIV